MYYTPKELLEGEGIDPQAGTGSFLKRIYDQLVKGLTANPPYTSGTTRNDKPDEPAGEV